MNLSKELSNWGFSGVVLTDTASKLIYATDASAYREEPLAVAYPKTNSDIQALIKFANKQKLSLIPRTAGTSLAGQVVGSGIVVDVSKNFTSILEVNEKEHWVRLQPGVVLDELNIYLKKYNLFFGPETSTSNRCMVGGMVGNNACGAHSLIYGSTRDHLLEIKGFLSDGSEVEFKSLSNSEFQEKLKLDLLEGSIYRQINDLLSNKQNQEHIKTDYPDPGLKRRNTGYAIDLLLNSEPFDPNTKQFNFCKLIAGSEGTLVFITEIKLNLIPLPPKEKGLICIHFKALEEALEANLIALKYNPGSIELIDDIILNCTKENIEQRKNRFFIEGEPGAILVIEFARENFAEIEALYTALKSELQQSDYGYSYPLVTGTDMGKVWALRKAALGLLSNVPGDAKPVSLVEDTAVHPKQLPAYIAEFKVMLKKYGLTSVFHAHVATGELHLRPVLNLRDEKDLILFRTIATETAQLVKKYKGSLSGEHGDGRLRGEFIPIIIGEHNYNLCKQIKQTWDSNNIFNPGKIVHTPPMDSSLRIISGKPVREIKTYFNFNDSQGIIRHSERCNGSADCRKTEIIGGTMCPSYMATRNENATTRARANIFREFLTNSEKKNPFNNKEIKETLDLCLSCKACKAECPSNVDMAKLKAEFLQQYHDAHGIPPRSWFIANMPVLYKLGSAMPAVFNFLISNKILSGIIKKSIGFAWERNIPKLSKQTVRNWAKSNLSALNKNLSKPKKEIYLFIDEFTNYTDTSVGIKAIELLHKLGYKIIIVPCFDSGRTSFSKGLLKKARKTAISNVQNTANLISSDKPLIGLEPSSILAFRDEYPDIVPENLRNEALKIASNTFLIEEFISKEIENGNISKKQFTKKPLNIALHGHCYQKSLASTKPVITILSLPENYSVKELATGCCGMAGAFGFEKEHYQVSMKVGELVLFPSIRKTTQETIIAASGTSCRQQIFDGTGRKAFHPIEILANAIV